MSCNEFCKKINVCKKKQKEEAVPVIAHIVNTNFPFWSWVICYCYTMFS